MSNSRFGFKTRKGEIDGILGNQILRTLDVFTGSVGSFSLQKIREAYSGSSVRVRRSSDNSEQDIGFSTSGQFDEQSLNSFCSGTNGFVTTWYDQSEYPNNATMGTALNQPKIYDSVSGIYYENTRPTIFFNNNQLLVNNLTLVLQPVSYFFVAKGQSTARQGNIISKNSFFAASFSDFPFVISLKNTFISASVSRGNDFSSDVSLTRVTTGNLQVYSVFQSVSQLGISIDSDLETTPSVTQSANTRVYSMGKASVENGGGVNTSGYTGYISEIIIYPFTQLSNREEIERKMKIFYNIS